MIYVLLVILFLIWALIFFKTKYKVKITVLMLFIITVIIVIYKSHKKQRDKLIEKLTYYNNFLKRKPIKDYTYKLSNIPIFVINLTRSINRRKHMEKQQQKYNINMTFIEAVDGLAIPNIHSYHFNDVSGNKVYFSHKNNMINKSELGCTLSHYKTIKEIYNQGLDYGLVCEDDANFVLLPFWDKTINEIMEEAPKDWHMIFLNKNCHDLLNRDKYIPYVEGICFSATAYIINKEGCKKILNRLNDGENSIKLKNPIVNNVTADVLLPTLNNSYTYHQSLILPLNNFNEMTSTIHSTHDKDHIYSSMQEMRKHYKTLFKNNSSIPKILHLIWIGPKDPPKSIDSWTKGFGSKFPDWEVKVWRDKDVDNLNLINKKEYNEVNEWYGKADILRLEILYKYGGVYVDADTVWLGEPIPDVLLDGYFNAFREKSMSIANGVISTIKKHPFLKELIKEIPNSIKENPDKPYWITTGPGLLHKCYEKLKHFTNPKDINIINNYDCILCPKSWHGINTKEKYLDKINYCKDKKAFCFHWGMSTNNT